MVATANVPANCRVMPTCFMVLGSLAQVQRQSLVTLVTNASQITAYPMAEAILITGANRGLGFEFASQYLADGWRVFAACRNPDAASKLRCLAQDTGGMLNVVAMDVTDAESVQNATTQLKDVAIDVLINSAGSPARRGRRPAMSTTNPGLMCWT